MPGVVQSITSLLPPLSVLLPLSLLGFILLKKVFGKKYNLPPGPFGWPILGNIIELNRDKRTWLYLAELGKKYGDIFSIQFGGLPTVVLNSTEHVKEALIDKKTEFAGRPYLLTGEIMSEGGFDVTTTDYSDVWKIQRKIIVRAIRFYLTSPHFEPLLENSIQEALESMVSESQKGAIDPRDTLNLAVYNITCGMCYGKRYTLSDPEFIALNKSANEFVELAGRGLPADYLPWLRYFPSRTTHDFERVIGEFSATLSKHWKQHQQNFDPDDMKDLMDFFIDAQRNPIDDEGPILEKMSDKHMCQLVFNFLEGGIDTATFSLYWFLLHVAPRPDIQKKVQQEIQREIGSATPRLSDRSRMPYTEAVIAESLRLGSIAALGVPHKAMCDSTIGGYDVPKGTMIVINHYAMHMDDKHWLNPHVFNPDRFIDADGKFTPKPPSFLPFSAGRRSCIGEPAARGIFFMFTTMLFQRFTIAFPPGEEPTTLPVEGGIAAVPYPYKIVVKHI